MIIINIKQGEAIERALKRYKQKVNKVKQLKNLKENQQFTKKSEARRKQLAKAIHKQKYTTDSEI